MVFFVLIKNSIHSNRWVDCYLFLINLRLLMFSCFLTRAFLNFKKMIFSHFLRNALQNYLQNNFILKEFVNYQIQSQWKIWNLKCSSLVKFNRYQVFNNIFLDFKKIIQIRKKHISYQYFFSKHVYTFYLT